MTTKGDPTICCSHLVVETSVLAGQEKKKKKKKKKKTLRVDESLTYCFVLFLVSLFIFKTQAENIFGGFWTKSECLIWKVFFLFWYPSD